MPLRIHTRQSQANNQDLPLLEKFLANHSGLTEVELLYPLSAGYSGCRVYLVIATVGSLSARNPWIVKVGPADEIIAEKQGHVLAHSFVSPPNIIQLIDCQVDAQEGILIYDFAGFAGRPPLDLEAVVRRIESSSAVKNVVEKVADWSRSQKSKSVNLGELLKKWTLPKLDFLPSTILETGETRVLNSPDFGEAYSNPLYHLQHDLRRNEPRCPIAFSHGDLNLRNILFNLPEGVPDIATPLFIDFRHASVDQLATIDLAKLESCLRYQMIGRIDSIDSLQQVVTFLAGSRNDLTMRNPPEALTDKHLQDLWRCIVPIRSAASKLFPESSKESETSYWITLMAYAISCATYDQIPLEVRHLAFLDAAALFTKYIVPRELDAPQRVLSAHERISPPVLVLRDQIPNSYSPLFARSVEKGQCVLVVGPSYGKTSGFEPFLHFVQRTYSELTGEHAPATIGADTILEILSKRTPRHEILRHINDRVARWKASPKEASDFSAIRWAAVLNWHFHDSPYKSLIEASGKTTVLRIEDVDNAVAQFDEIKNGATPYVPMYGDVASTPDSLVLAHADRRLRLRVIGLIAQALEQRQMPLSLAFWQCEQVPVEELARLRSTFL